MMKRKRSSPAYPRSANFSLRSPLKAEAADLPDGFQKDIRFEKIRQLEAASTMNTRLAPSG